MERSTAFFLQGLVFKTVFIEYMPPWSVRPSILFHVSSDSSKDQELRPALCRLAIEGGALLVAPLDAQGGKKIHDQSTPPFACMSGIIGSSPHSIEVVGENGNANCFRREAKDKKQKPFSPSAEYSVDDLRRWEYLMRFAARSGAKIA